MSRNKRKRGKVVLNTADFFGMHYQPATDPGHSSDDEQEENHAWVAQRDRQKAASAQAATRASAERSQLGVLLGEERDFRTQLCGNENNTRTRLQETINEHIVEREWIEFQIARREEQAQAERVKKAAFIPLITQQLLHRADIADKETENRLSFFDSFAASMQNAQAAERTRLAREQQAKLEADRRKAAERARAFEERARKAITQRPALFTPAATAPAASGQPQPPEATQKGFFSGWFSK